MSEAKNNSELWETFRVLSSLFIMLIPAAWVLAVVFMMPTVNKATGQPYSCVVESVRLDESSGGPRTSTSHSTVFAYTSNCGDIYIKRLEGMDVGSHEELAQKLEERKGQVVVFHIGRMQLSSNTLRAERVEF